MRDARRSGSGRRLRRTSIATRGLRAARLAREENIHVTRVCNLEEVKAEAALVAVFAAGATRDALTRLPRARALSPACATPSVPVALQVPHGYNIFAIEVPLNRAPVTSRWAGRTRRRRPRGKASRIVGGAGWPVRGDGGGDAPVRRGALAADLRSGWLRAPSRACWNRAHTRRSRRSPRGTPRGPRARAGAAAGRAAARSRRSSVPSLGYRCGNGTHCVSAAPRGRRREEEEEGGAPLQPLRPSVLRRQQLLWRASVELLEENDGGRGRGPGRGGSSPSASPPAGDGDGGSSRHSPPPRATSRSPRARSPISGARARRAR